MRALKGLSFAVLFAVLFCTTVVEAQLPAVVSYPTADTGWSLVGNIQPQGCIGTACQYMPPGVDGFVNGGNVIRTIGGTDKAEQQVNELLQVQSNGQGSGASLLVSLPTSTTYKLALDVLGAQSTAPLGGQSVFPVVQITVNGVAEPLCQYPNNVSITQTTSVTVNNPRGTLLEYVTTCSLSLFAGNNTIGFQIVGGQGHGGLLTVRHILVYKTSGITGNAACYENVGGHINYFTTTLTAADLFTLQTNELNWKAATCGGSIQGSWMNLRTGFFIFAQGCNGSQACALTQMN